MVDFLLFLFVFVGTTHELSLPYLSLLSTFVERGIKGGEISFQGEII
jgi:hypothetical protein